MHYCLQLPGVGGCVACMSLSTGAAPMPRRSSRQRNHSIRDSAVGDVRFASLGLQKVSAAAASRGQIFASKIEPSVISPHLQTSAPTTSFCWSGSSIPASGCKDEE